MTLNSNVNLKHLNQEIISCEKCKRLVSYRKEVANNPPKRYAGEKYWARPVAGFGDFAASLLIVGLAPAAHGANRTGRMFTGDNSGKWLYKALFELGMANKEQSFDKNDELALKKVYITASLKCVPPQNKPSKEELINCRQFLFSEYHYFKVRSLKAIMALGHIAFNSVRQLLRFGPEIVFKHGALYDFDGLKLVCCYHPSQQNTFTKKLTWDMFISTMKLAKDAAEIL
jgi:uracil-DNA glycosylase family 4